MTDAADLRHRSRHVLDGPEWAPHRSMYRAMGFQDEDFKKPLVGVASTWGEVTPCSVALHAQAEDVKAGVREHGGARASLRRFPSATPSPWATKA